MKSGWYINTYLICVESKEFSRKKSEFMAVHAQMHLKASQSPQGPLNVSIKFSKRGDLSIWLDNASGEE